MKFLEQMRQRRADQKFAQWKAERAIDNVSCVRCGFTKYYHDFRGRDTLRYYGLGPACDLFRAPQSESEET